MTNTDPTRPSGLNAENIHKSYPTPAEPLAVLRGVSLSLSPGESLAIVGPSGSGKTTLLNILAAMDKPTSGTVCLDGQNPFALSQTKLAKYRSERIGLVFQDHHLLPQCTAEDNLLVAALAKGRTGAADAARASELLERVGLAERRTHLPAELSGGERQRVAAARALMNSPALLLCDEPTGNLDADAADALGELLVELAEQTNAMLIVATHSQSLAGRMQRRLRLRDGRLVNDDD